MKKYILLIVLIPVFLCSSAYAQMKSTAITNHALYQIVNTPTTKESFAKSVNAASTGAIAPAAIAAAPIAVPTVLLAQSSFSVSYGVPLYVVQDRHNLFRAVDEEMATLIGHINYWKSRGSDATFQKIIDMHQKNLNRLNQLYDDAYMRTLTPFNTLRLDVRTDLRYYSPVGNRLGLVRANAGQVNLSSMYSNISHDEIYRLPVSGTFIIYKK